MESLPESHARTTVLYAITKSNWGGAQAYVYALAQGARAAGAGVAVALGGDAHGRPGLLSARLAEDGIRTVPLSRIRRDLGLVREFRAFGELVRVMRREAPDVLHLNSSKMGVLGALAGRIAGVPRIVFTAHGWPHREPRALPWRLLAWIASWLTVFLSHAVIVVSDCDLRTAPAILLRRKLVRIHNGIEPLPLVQRAQARAALVTRASGLERFPHWLLMNAELHPNKGIDIAVRALAQLAGRFPDTALVVQGEGQERERLVALARAQGVADRVFLTGFTQDARSLLQAADVYLMPSRKEGFPMALLEAGAAGLPVIAARVGGIPELIEHERTGLLVTPGDPAALAAAIASLRSDSLFAERLGTALRDRVLREHSSERMLAATFACYPLSRY